MATVIGFTIRFAPCSKLVVSRRGKTLEAEATAYSAQVPLVETDTRLLSKELLRSLPPERTTRRHCPRYRGSGEEALMGTCRDCTHIAWVHFRMYPCALALHPLINGGLGSIRSRRGLLEITWNSETHSLVGFNH